MRLMLLSWLSMIAIISAPAWGQGRAGALPERKAWMVGGVEREALVHVPESAKQSPAPVVFVFHGHGGSMQQAARRMNYHAAWPEAIVVYPQGLNTPGRLTDPEGKKSGWQAGKGDQQDRDLLFFDAMLDSLKMDYLVDERRVYATGHSNGGGFTYLLWAERGDKFAAFAPSASAAGRRMSELKPKPIMHLTGKNNPLIKFAWQSATIEIAKKVNGAGEGKAEGPLTHYESKQGTPVVTYITDGNHSFEVKAIPEVVKFFKAHSKPQP